MRKLIVAAFVSLDGVMQAPGGPEEDISGDFRLGGWVAPYADDPFDEAIKDLFSQPFELVLGRRTYDIFSSYWPRVPPESKNFVADLFNRVPKHVATHRPGTLDWQNSRALQGGIADAIGALKREGGPNLLTQGSGDLVRQLFAAGLVDELRLVTLPVVLGHGKRLFGDDAQAAAFTLAHSSTTSKGVVITRFERSGEVRTGTVGEGA